MTKEWRLTLVREIARIAATEREPENLASRFLSCLVCRWPGADAGILLVYDPDDARLIIRAAEGYDLGELSRMRIAPGEGMSGKIFQSGQGQVFPVDEAIQAARADLLPVNRELFNRGTISGKKPTSAISVPLVRGRAKIGVLILEASNGPRAFDAADLPFLQDVGTLMSGELENVRLNQELARNAAEVAANRVNAEALSFLAHEMRTPLTSIKGYSTALLLEEATFSPDMQREFLQIIDQECDTLVDLIHDLLETSLIEAGRMELEPQPVRLPRIAEAVAEEIRNRSSRHHLLVEFPPDLPMVEADPDRIAQVLRNLLDNAVKYSPNGGLIVVRGERGEDEIIISVADQGIGIAPEHLNRLFEKFFRVKEGPNRDTVGSGLGLPIARNIVESHGGRIWAESRLGEGSTLYFTLPMIKLDEELQDE